MSVFKDKKCTVCGHREALPKKTKCHFCDPRFDGKGQLYIIAADIHSYFREDCLKKKKKGMVVKVWCCEGIVRKINASSHKKYDRFIGKPFDSVHQALKNLDFLYEYKTEAGI